MAKSASSEVVALCASIIGDGEVSPEEAYQLAEWLNNHPAAATTWPGSGLVQPLQEVWADGKANKRDLHRLARLLISVQREWARHPSTDISPVNGDTTVEFVVDAHLDDARLPSVEAKFRVPSQNEMGRFYEVNLSGPTCTCPDWRTWRSRLPAGDLTRCCKHVLYVYAKLARRKDTDGWLMAFIDNGWPPHPGAEWHLLSVGANKVLFCTASEKGWANVFAKDGREYARFGFNVDEDRWAYGSQPSHGEVIAEAIRSLRNKQGRQDRGDGIVPSENKIPRPRTRFTALWVSAAIIAVIAFLAMIQQRPAPNTQVDRPAIMTPPAQSPAVQSPTATPLFRNVPVTQPTTNSFPPRVKTIRAIRAETGQGEILIPNKIELRVLGREGSDLLVSYNGWTVTIPASAVSSTAR